MAMQVFDSVILVAIGAVVVVLVIGLINLNRSGAQARTRSNQLMRLRVILQAVAVVLLLAAAWPQPGGRPLKAKAERALGCVSGVKTNSYLEQNLHPHG